MHYHLMISSWQWVSDHDRYQSSVSCKYMLDICQFWGTIALFIYVKVHQKVRKFAWKKYTTAGGGGGDKYELCVSICKLVIVQLATLRASSLSAQTLTETKTKLLRKNPFSKLVNSSFNCKYWISKQITFMVQWRNPESKLFFSQEGC